MLRYDDSILTPSPVIVARCLRYLHEVSFASHSERAFHIHMPVHDIACFGPLTAEDENTLGWKIMNERCSASLERMVLGNLRLVVSIAQHYMGRGLDIALLLEYGNIGLRCAAETFDPAQGARFSTLASWWIKHAIKRAIGDPSHHRHSMGAVASER